jgi:YidC/Oxa1 family membrane protein insertase
MDRIRFALWFGLLASIWISYSTWVADRPAEPVAAANAAGAPATAGDETPPVLDNDAGAVPVVVNTDSSAVGAAPADESAPPPARLVNVRTDVLDVQINLDGGDIVRVDLPMYPVHKDRPDEPVRLLDYTDSRRWVYQTGIASTPGTPAPTHDQAFSAAASSYALADGADTLEVRLGWQGPNGVSAEKIYTFHRGGYAIDLAIVARNQGAVPWTAGAYAWMTRLHNPLKRSYLSVDSYSFTGPVIYNGDSYKKIKVDELVASPEQISVANGWLASIQHHFLAAIVPPAMEIDDLSVEAIGQSYRLKAHSPASQVAPGAELRYPVTLFVGPKLQDQLAAAAPDRDLRLTVDYGAILTPIAQPLFWVLSFIHDWVKNWGLSIVITTLLIKLVFYKLTATSGRSMAKMRKLAPRMKALQEKHKDDRQALSTAMLDLYKKEKVNPAAGCLPILIQMPFFFAFYWVLVESVEMRQAPFMLWINDLSVRDPFFILPLLMGAAMLFQMRLNPAPPDPVQARIMQIMPIVFTAMFAFFPAGLVLYWLTNTVASIAQQWRINTLVARES